MSGSAIDNAGRSLKLQRQDIADAYRLLLDRNPESEAEIDRRLAAPIDSVGAFLKTFANSQEFKGRLKRKDRTDFFTTTQDARAIIMRHDNKQRQPAPHSFVNFLGVRTDLRYSRQLATLGERVETPPIPSNCHAEMVEWAAALRAVELSKDSFTVMELGAGWGCWMVNTAFAAKRLGKKVFAIGIEGDAGHFEFIDEHCARNGITKDEYVAKRLIVGARDGVALIPVVSDSANSYGQEPKFFNSKKEANDFLMKSTYAYASVPIVSLEEAAGDKERIDLLHIDIQGGETDVIAGTLETLAKRVAYIVIGTHSRTIDGDLIRLLSANGFRLEFEKPATIRILPDGQLVTIMDGTQGWRNLSLTK